jgi:hypothetical protein
VLHEARQNFRAEQLGQLAAAVAHALPPPPRGAPALRLAPGGAGPRGADALGPERAEAALAAARWAARNALLALPAAELPAVLCELHGALLDGFGAFLHAAAGWVVARQPAELAAPAGGPRPRLRRQCCCPPAIQD